MSRWLEMFSPAPVHLLPSVGLLCIFHPEHVDERTICSILLIHRQHSLGFLVTSSISDKREGRDHWGSPLSAGIKLSPASDTYHKDTFQNAWDWTWTLYLVSAVAKPLNSRALRSVAYYSRRPSSAEWSGHDDGGFLCHLGSQWILPLLRCLFVSTLSY